MARPLKLKLVVLLTTPLAVAEIALAQQTGTADLETIEVEAERLRGADRQPVTVRPGTAADTARHMDRAPGGSVANNGPVSGQVQYRGLFGPRMNVRIDGMGMTPGGPNWMDPPLHYLPAGQIESLEVERGIASVSSGSSTLGGTVRARSRQSRFTSEDAFDVRGSVGGAARSANDSASADVFVAAANRRHRVHFGAVSESGDDIDFGDGTIDASEFERDQARVGYGHRGDFGEIGFQFSRTETGDSGNPSLPLDMKFTDTDIARLELARDFGEVRVEASIYGQSVDHEMTNFRLRDAPDFNPMVPGPDRRRVEATGDSTNFDLAVTLPQWGGALTLGGDAFGSSHDMDIFDPDRPAFFVEQFNDAETERMSVFAEWSGALGRRLAAEFGLRLTHVETDAGRVDAAPARTLPPPQRLRDGFNAADRERSDDNVDAVAKLDYALDDALTLQLGLARKTRSPTHIERYLWLPLEVSAGLADGNNYVGDIGLDPEVAHKVDLGVEWTDGAGYVAPRVFFSDVDDFIDGNPATDPDVVAVSTLNGDSSPLQFSNVGAELYGIDVDWGWSLSGRWRVDGTISVVRGERDDGDDLFRMPADRAITGLTYAGGAWSATVEAELVAEQSRVSETLVLDEPSTSNDDTPGYGLLNVSGRWRPVAGLTLSGGIDNLLDKSRAVHTNGFNRVQGSDVGLGERLPGTGRNVYLEIAYDF